MCKYTQTDKQMISGKDRRGKRTQTQADTQSYTHKYVQYVSITYCMYADIHHLCVDSSGVHISSRLRGST